MIKKVEQNNLSGKIFLRQKMDFSVALNNLQKNFSPYFNKLLNFNFQILNPVFWLFFLFLLLALLKFWRIKKSFSFCSTVAIILLLETKVENYVVNFFKNGGEAFPGVTLRIMAIVMILAVLLYYSFVKGDD